MSSEGTTAPADIPFEEQLELLKQATLSEIVLSNGTIVRLAPERRYRWPRPRAQSGAGCSAPRGLRHASLRRLYQFLFSDAWCVHDCCGLLCCVITWGLVLYAASIMTYLATFLFDYLIARFAAALVVWLLGLMAIISHLKAVFTNPGAQPLNNCTESNILQLPANSLVQICRKCMCIKPERTHHCSVCNRCIKRMDHHCPWINNCVGQSNQKFFMLFIFYVILLSVASIISLVLLASTCVSPRGLNNSACEKCLSQPTIFTMVLILAMETALFGMFTCIMLCSQLYSVCTDETKLDRREYNLPCSQRILNFQIVCGGPPSLAWLLPFNSSRFQRHYQSPLFNMSV